MSDVKTLRMTLTKDKETKGTIRYKEVNPRESEPHTFYFRKETIGLLNKPDTIEVLVTPVIFME